MIKLVAYFLTWTTYLTWLHGDERFSVDHHQNQRGTSRLKPDGLLRYRDRSTSGGDPVTLSPEERNLVHTAIEQCAEYRGWKILALNVRTNHVHCIVQVESHSPERVMTDFKARATRSLREAGLRTSDETIWTKHGSTRWINEDTSLRAAMDYVLNDQ